MRKVGLPKGKMPSQMIDARIAELDDWRGETLGRLRALIKEADHAVVEEWKWGVPVWSHGGILCTGETYKSVVKMTFARGASLKDPARLFNSSLEGKVRRAIDIREGEKINGRALKALVRAAVALNVLLMSGCGGGTAVYGGKDPSISVAVIEGYTNLLYGDKVQITGVDRTAETGMGRAVFTGVTRAVVPPGERCVQIEIKGCAGGACGEPAVCAFTNYFVAGQVMQLKGGGLKLDKPASSGEVVNGTLQVEVSATGFATVTRRLAVSCGSGVRGVCERGTPELPRQALPGQAR